MYFETSFDMKLAEKMTLTIFSDCKFFFKLVLLFLWSVPRIDVYVAQVFRPVEVRIVLIGKTEQDQGFIPPWNNVEVDCQVLNLFSLFLLCS